MRLLPFLRAAAHRFLCVVIDSAGEIELPAHPAQLELEIADARDDAIRSDIIDWGYIDWVAFEGHVRIRMRPSATSVAARNRLIDWLSHCQPERVRLNYFAEGSWHHEYVRGSGFRAADRIDDLMSEHGGDGLRHRRRRLRDVRHAPGHEAAIGYWRCNRERFIPAEALPILGPAVANSYVLLKASDPSDYRIAAHGSSLPGFARPWLAANIGAPIRAHPDSEHGRVAAETYRQVQCSAEPRLEDVDAFVTWPGAGRLRRRYSRLTLPFKSADADWILSATRVDEGIDLRA